MDPMVLLRHDTPDGEFHYDWMLSRAGDVQGPLLTLRVLSRVDQRGAGPTPAERIGDHRRAFLEFEGELSRGRGTVRRVASGRCRVLSESPDRIEVDLDWGAGVERWTFVASAPRGAWTARRVTPPAPDRR